MKTLLKRGLALGLLPIVLLCTAAYMYRGLPARTGNVDTVLLLLPDDVDVSNIIVHEWLDAAEEEGIHLGVVHDSEFLNPMRQRPAAKGLIVPDLVHRSANGALIGALHDYVHRGGQLMVVYDACTWDLNQHFTKVESRLSDLVGVSYALYDQYRVRAINWSSVWGTAENMAQLGIPPGKYVAPRDLDLGPELKAASLLADAPGPVAQGDEYVLTRYQYGDLKYPTFRTAGKFAGKVLLESNAGLIAGTRDDGRGRILFVNLPLGYLEARTDGLLLHSFVRYFSVQMLKLPYLASVPDGVGGLVFNWHIDAQSSIRPLQTLLAAGMFEQGPFSIHVTAGPDVDAFNDGKGLNIEHNPEGQRLLGELMRRGHVIGSHGGWIHNYFGEHVDETNESDFSKYLELNMDAMQKVSGKRITEYSAPVGNHPRWVTQWLDHKGVLAYYFSGDTGMGPTHVYRDGERDGASIWAFPILHFGQYASFEEMGFDHVPEPIVRRWLTQVTDFVADNRAARLLYTHPMGAIAYLASLDALMKKTGELAAEHKFRWYTMTDLANFLNLRRTVQWTASETEANAVVLEAQAPNNLAHQTWVFPKSAYATPHVVQGKAEIKQDRAVWLITAGDCKQLTVEFGPESLSVASRSSEDK